MLIKATATNGYSVVANDGSIGTVSDMLFDDANWTVRWLVVETGSWLLDKRVLIPVAALGHPNPVARTFPVKLTKAQVEASPDVDTHLPVSRQYEATAYSHYGFGPYWQTDLYMSGFAYWGGIYPPGPSLDAEWQKDSKHPGDDPHLRSMAEISGYHIHATDGDIGHLADVLIEDADWTLRYMIVNTSNWWQGREVLISPRSTQSIRWTERSVYVGVNREKVQSGPSYDLSRRLDAAFDTEMADHYGPPIPAVAA